jgi:hypothetical protein
MKIKKNKIPDAINQLKNSLVNNALKTSALLVHGDATRIVPVLTGRLKASLNYKVENNTATVGTNVEYAEKIEYGGSQKAPQGYLRPAFYKNEDKIKEIFNKALKGLEIL